MSSEDEARVREIVNEMLELREAALLQAALEAVFERPVGVVIV